MEARTSRLQEIFHHIAGKVQLASWYYCTIEDMSPKIDNKVQYYCMLKYVLTDFGNFGIYMIIKK